jgi:hypothetical protein
MDTRREATLERQIEAVKRDLVALEDLRPGSLSTQFNVCGTPGCRCKATPPEKHGPYYQVSYTRKGKSGSKFRHPDLGGSLFGTSNQRVDHFRAGLGMAEGLFG